MARPEIPTACYRFYDAEGVPLYFGVAVDPDRRWLTHRRTDWWDQVDHTRTCLDWYDTWDLAHEAEVEAIAAEHPRHNLAHAQPDPDWGLTFPSEQARKELSRLLGMACFGATRVTITRSGRRAGVMVPPDWYDRAHAALADQDRPPRKRA